MEARRLFDIVGLDEGTCGRRPRSATTSGCRGSVKSAVPNVSLHIHSICEVQERLPEMPASSSVFPGVVVVHQLESLILAQNERWRQA